MTDNNYGIELYHHGVKGMKWGVRRKLSDAVSKHRETRRAIKEQYKAIRNDPNSYSTREKLLWNTRKLSKATAKRMVKKGEDFDTAKKKVKRNALALMGVTTAAQVALSNPKVQKFMSESFSKIKNATSKSSDRGWWWITNKMVDTEILNKNGERMSFSQMPVTELTKIRPGVPEQRVRTYSR